MAPGWNYVEDEEDWFDLFKNLKRIEEEAEAKKKKDEEEEKKQAQASRAVVPAAAVAVAIVAATWRPLTWAERVARAIAAVQRKPAARAKIRAKL